MTSAAGILRKAAVGADYEQAPYSNDVEWQLRGACRRRFADDPAGTDLMFHPVGDHLQFKSQAAIRVCKTECPVLKECQMWALSRHERYGVWGGMSEIDRDALWSGHRKYMPWRA